MSNMFNPENSLWQAVSKMLDILMLSLLWLFLSLPLLTAGAATAALYDATVKCVKPGEKGAVKQFFTIFIREIKTATLATLIWGGLCALLIKLVWTVRGNIIFEDITAVIILAIWFLVLIIPVGTLCWMFPLLSRFTFNVKGLIVTAFRIALGYLPYTFVVVVSTLVAVIISVWLLVPMLILPCITAIIWSLPMERVFLKYQK